MREVFAETTEIAEPAGEADAGHRGTRFRGFKHEARMTEANALGKLEGRVAAALLECAEHAPYARSGHFRQSFDFQRLVPIGGDIAFRTSHLPRCRSRCAGFEILAVAVVARAEE